MNEPPTRPQQPAESKQAPARPTIIKAGDLLQQSREIWIDHDGVVYRLRLTRRNKLILQK
jgi:hemin uptake protein HemP